MRLLVINDCRIFLEEFVRTFAYCLLQGNDRLGIVEVVFLVVTAS